MGRPFRLILAAVPVLVVGLLAVEVVVAQVSTRLDDEDGIRPVRRRANDGDATLHVLWLGDSTTTGVGAADFADSMAFRVAAELGRAEDRGVEVSVLGVSGHQVHEVLDQQLPELVAMTSTGDDGDVPDVVFVSIGANDVTALTRIPTFRDRYRRMVDVIEATVPGADVVLVGIPDMGTAPRLLPPLRQIAGLRAARLDDVVADVAAERQVDYVDLAGLTSRTFSSDPDRFFAADGFHPSSDGHGIWARAVLDSVVGSLES